MLLLLPKISQRIELLPLKQRPIINILRWSWLLVASILLTACLFIFSRNQKAYIVSQKNDLSQQIASSQQDVQKIKTLVTAKNIVGALTPIYISQRRGVLPYLQALSGQLKNNIWFNSISIGWDKDVKISFQGSAIEADAIQSWLSDLNDLPVFSSTPLLVSNLTWEEVINPLDKTGAADNSIVMLSRRPGSGRVLFYRPKFGAQVQKDKAIADNSFMLSHFNFEYFYPEVQPTTKPTR